MGDCCEGTCDTEYSFYACGANQPYTCADPSAGTHTNPSGSSVYPQDFHDGFEANAFDSHWKLGGDADWVTEAEVYAAEGAYYAEARTD